MSHAVTTDLAVLAITRRVAGTTDAATCAEQLRVLADQAKLDVGDLAVLLGVRLVKDAARAVRRAKQA